MRNKCDLSDFEYSVVVGAMWAGLSISGTAALLEFFHTFISRVYREWSKKEKLSSDQHVLGEKTLFILEVRGEWPDCSKLIRRLK